MTDSRRIRVLLLAEMANPAWQSVPLVGWSHCEAISRVTDAHLVTQIRNREDILHFGYREGVDFTALDSERIAKPMWTLASLLRGGAGKGWTTIQALAPISYYYFEYLAWQKFKARLKAGEFDIVHRVTPMSPAVPSPMAKWCESIGVPFVLGPLNGGLPWPKEFPTLARQENEWLAPFREAYRWLPYQQSTRSKSTAVLVGSRNVWDLWKAENKGQVFYMPENGIDPIRFGVPDRVPATRPIKLLFVGRMVPYKAADLVIEATAELMRRGDVELTMIGDGPHREYLEQLATRLSLGDSIRFLNSVPHTELAKHYQHADIFGFPSLRELGGAVVLEAMVQGVVPIVVDYGGPPEFVTANSGVTIPLGDRAAIIHHFREAVERFVNQPELLKPMSELARQDVLKRFTWDAKAADDVAVYRWLLGHDVRPELTPPDGCHSATESTPEPFHYSATR
jgi:glycosyltransferase involved in cell wall biosynthesis